MKLIVKKRVGNENSSMWNTEDQDTGSVKQKVCNRDKTQENNRLIESLVSLIHGIYLNHLRFLDAETQNALTYHTRNGT
uniref:Uncharacterized protein n=1 Tax=Romanomermis culicivorax TaxID=13658 RepID=A0A915JWN3_ROMCU